MGEATINTEIEIEGFAIPWACVPSGLISDALGSLVSSGALLTYAFLLVRFDRHGGEHVWGDLALERGISVRAFRDHLRHLEDAGWLKRELYDLDGVGTRAMLKLFVVRHGRTSATVAERIGGAA